MSEQPATDERSGDAYGNVSDQTEAVALHEDTREPARDSADDQKNN